MLTASSGRMVMQPTADFLVGGLNPGRANMAGRCRRRQSTNQDSNRRPKTLQSAALPFERGLM